MRLFSGISRARLLRDACRLNGTRFKRWRVVYGAVLAAAAPTPGVTTFCFFWFGPTLPLTPYGIYCTYLHYSPPTTALPGLWVEGVVGCVLLLGYHYTHAYSMCIHSTLLGIWAYAYMRLKDTAHAHAPAPPYLATPHPEPTPLHAHRLQHALHAAGSHPLPALSPHQARPLVVPHAARTSVDRLLLPDGSWFLDCDRHVYMVVGGTLLSECFSAGRCQTARRTDPTCLSRDTWVSHSLKCGQWLFN